MPDDFFGDSFDPALDAERLTNLRANVRALMLDGTWRSRAEISRALGVSEAADIGRRLRELPEEKHGGWNVEKRRRVPAEKGVWEYRINGHVDPDASENPFAGDPAMLRDEPETRVLEAAREYAEAARNTDDPDTLATALERLRRAALELG